MKCQSYSVAILAKKNIKSHLNSYNSRIVEHLITIETKGAPWPPLNILNSKITNYCLIYFSRYFCQVTNLQGKTFEVGVKQCVRESKLRQGFMLCFLIKLEIIEPIACSLVQFSRAAFLRDTAIFNLFNQSGVGYGFRV
jgi:hypothetical protein